MGLVNINDKHDSSQLTILMYVESRNQNDRLILNPFFIPFFGMCDIICGNFAFSPFQLFSYILTLLNILYDCFNIFSLLSSNFGTKQ